MIQSDQNVRHATLIRRRPVAWLGRIVALLVPGLALELIRLAGGPAPFGADALARWSFVIAVPLVAVFGRPVMTQDGHWVWPWQGYVAVAGGAAAGVSAAFTGSTALAWLGLGAGYILLLHLGVLLRPYGRWARGVGILFLAAVGGLAPAALAEIEAHFADEEFFVALQALGLAMFCLLLLALHDKVFPARPVTQPRGAPLKPWAIGLVLMMGLALGGFSVVTRYQRSFYPSTAPGYPGISAGTPFVCGQASGNPQVYDGRDVFQRLLARVAANPQPATPDFGMLALGTGEPRWAQMFHDALLAEVRQANYTGPANSMKSAQWEAALRLYYYPRVAQKFTALFSPAERQQVAGWFAAINRRALTVEWVDWMYGLALGTPLTGPYENQENGAGLLALLEAEGFADPSLSAANRAYLDSHPRGWVARFRNTDDAVVYQPIWLTNAYFQSLYTGRVPADNLALSFRWLLLQATPDGSGLTQNYPQPVSLAAADYLGARLTGDKRYLWLAGQAVAALEAKGAYLHAQPGIEEAIEGTGQAPQDGSCVIYGDSGLPTQAGVLAPDKVVLRDGWTDDSSYLLLDLRFTGWHRYKATGAITVLSQGQPVLRDVLSSKPFAWLPVGRQLFRDKRIPRENLNGLLVPRTGMAAVLFSLSGIGGPWAQDPPYYATVTSFATGPDRDEASIKLSDWRGWQQQRTIYLYHRGGPVVIWDDAQGPAGSQAALMWHLSGGSGAVSAGGAANTYRARLPDPSHPAEVVFVPIAGSQPAASQDASDQGVSVAAAPDGHLRVATVLLSGGWIDAGVSANHEGAGLVLHIASGNGSSLAVALPAAGPADAR